MNPDQNQSAHIRAVIAASPEPMSFGQIAAAAGVETKGLGTSLNRMVCRGHLVREGALGSFRYSIGTGEIRYVRCQTEEERRERYLFCQQRRRDKRRLANGGRTREEWRQQKAAERAAAAARKAADQQQRQAASVARRAEAEAKKVARKQRLAERAAARLERARSTAEKKAARHAPKKVQPVVRALVLKASSKPVQPARPAMTSEDFIAAGGVVERIPGFQRIAERPVTNYGRH